MPSLSQSQQRLFGMVDAYKKGKLKHPSAKIKEVAEHISLKDTRDFAKTKHEGLPAHVKKSNVLTPEIADILQGIFNAQRTPYSLNPDVLSSLGKKNGVFTGTTQEISPVETNMHYKKPGFVSMNSEPNSAFITTKTAKDSYIEGFIKKSFSSGLTLEEIDNLMKEAGFEKEAFLPMLLRLAAIFGGGVGADALGAKLTARALGARRAENAVADSLPGGLYGPKLDPVVNKTFNLKATPKINNLSDRVNQTLNTVGDLHQKHPWAFGTAGSMLAPMLAEPFISSMDKPTEQPQPSYAPPDPLNN